MLVLRSVLLLLGCCWASLQTSTESSPDDCQVGCEHEAPGLSWSRGVTSVHHWCPGVHRDIENRIASRSSLRRRRGDRTHFCGVASRASCALPPCWHQISARGPESRLPRM